MIEKALEKDLIEIIKMWTEVSIKEFVNYIGKENIIHFIESGELEKESRQLLDKTFVFRKDNSVYGFVVIIDNLIELMVVKQEYQNKLIGKKLFDFAIDKIKSRYKELKIECFEKNKRVNSICQRLNFRFQNSYKDIDMGFVTNVYTKEL